jgi:hypothetical protein
MLVSKFLVNHAEDVRISVLAEIMKLFMGGVE